MMKYGRTGYIFLPPLFLTVANQIDANLAKYWHRKNGENSKEMATMRERSFYGNQPTNTFLYIGKRCAE